MVMDENARQIRVRSSVGDRPSATGLPQKSGVPGPSRLVSRLTFTVSIVGYQVCLCSLPHEPSRAFVRVGVWLWIRWGVTRICFFVQYGVSFCFGVVRFGFKAHLLMDDPQLVSQTPAVREQFLSILEAQIGPAYLQQ